MEVSITKFRREMFDLVNQALSGNEVWVIHKGRRIRITPEDALGSRLSRITPIEITNPKSQELDNRSLQEEMTRAWEKDWSTL